VLVKGCSGTIWANNQRLRVELASVRGVVRFCQPSRLISPHTCLVISRVEKMTNRKIIEVDMKAVLAKIGGCDYQKSLQKGS